MACFSSLPNELLCRICYYVHPGDIISFSTLNRQAYYVAATKLAKHKELYFRWAVVDDSAWLGRYLENAYFWSNLLRNCLIGSPIAYYIEHLRIRVPNPIRNVYVGDHEWDEDTNDMQLVRYQPIADSELSPIFNPYTAGTSSEEYCKYFGSDLATCLSESWSPHPRPYDDEPDPMDLARVALMPLLTNLRVLELGLSYSIWHNQLLALILSVVR
ncbi:hypothetical protein MMC34_003320 [Xylographa carneopallida]|nr:hypothetical protein [Xylographa carneopallida]